MKSRHISILLPVFLAACSSDPAPDDAALQNSATTEPAVRDLLSSGPELRAPHAPSGKDESAGGSSRVIARVGTGELDYVEWSISPGDDDRVDIGISVSYPNRPLVPSSFAKTRSPIEVFLAVAPLDMSVPGPLLERAKGGAAIDIRLERRLELAAEARSLLAGFPALASAAGTTPAPLQAASCSNFFKNWASGVYGEDGTCGLQNATVGYSRNESYCAYGSCTHKLPASGIAECDESVAWGLELEACDLLEGTLDGVKGRVTNWNGDASWSHGGHRMHTGVANCVGNGSLKYTETRGAFTDDHFVAPNSMLHYFRGPGVHRPTQSWAYGAWNDDTPASGSSYLTSKLDIAQNSGEDDRAIGCVDWEVSYSMSNASPGSCHGLNASLCTSDCDTACFDIVGY